jgi:hypothetical protein
MASSADIQAQIDSLNDKISNLSGGLGDAGTRTTYQSKIRSLQSQLSAAQQAEDQQRQQQEQQSQQQNNQRQQDEQRQREEQQRQQDEQRQREAQQLQQQQQQQSATPISEVAPQAAGNQLPTLKQSIIDEQFKNKRTNELTSFNSDIRDKIVDAGWNEKSDAVRILNGAGVYGIVAAPASMGSIGYKKLNGGSAGEQDFIDAAKAAGIDPNQYMNSETIYGKTSKTLDQTKLYDALQEKGKDLYSVTNSLSGAGGRGDATPHATVLYKADGSGNLVVQTNAETGQPDVKYFDAIRYKEAPGFFEEYGPFLALLPAVTGVLQYAKVLPSFSTAAGTAGSGGGAFPPGAGGYGSVGPAGFTASNAAGGLASGIDDVVAAFNSSQGGAGIDPSLGFTASQVGPSRLAAEAAGIGGGFAGSALLGGAALGAGGSQLANALNTGAIVSGIGAGVGGIGAYLGAKEQSDAAKDAAASQLSMFNTINKQFAPQRGAGYQSLNQIRSMLPGQSITYNELGQPIGTQEGTDYLTRQFTPQDLQAGLAPNYNFMLQQGQNLNQRQANLSGGAIGGNALRGLQQFTQDYAGNAYQNAFNNFQSQRTGIYNTLAGIAGIGQKAQESTSQAGQNATTAAAQLGVGSAAATAAGYTGAANALAGGLQNYQQNQILQAVLGQNQNVAQQTPRYYG